MVRLNEITSALRDVLHEGVNDLKMDAQASAYLDQYLDRLLDSERELLPRRKRRALDEMTAVLSEYQLEASNSHKQRAFEFYSQLLDVLKMNESIRTGLGIDS